MSTKSKKKSSGKKIHEKLEDILSALNKKERELQKSIEDMEEKLTVRTLQEKIRAKQRAINHLDLKKDGLERKLEEALNQPMSKGDEVKQEEETNALPLVVPPSPQLDLEAIRKAIREP